MATCKLHSRLWLCRSGPADTIVVHGATCRIITVAPPFNVAPVVQSATVRAPFEPSIAAPIESSFARGGANFLGRREAISFAELLTSRTMATCKLHSRVRAPFEPFIAAP